MTYTQGVTEGSCIWSSADPQEIALNLQGVVNYQGTNRVLCSRHFRVFEKKDTTTLFYYQVVTWKNKFPKKRVPTPPIKYLVIPGNPSFLKKAVPPPPLYYTVNSTKFQEARSTKV